MDKDRRTGVDQVPGNLKEILNEAQLLSLNKLEGFGWSLEFIRRPLFQEIVPVLFHPDTRTVATLTDDGTLNTRPDIQVRE